MMPKRDFSVVCEFPRTLSALPSEVVNMLVATVNNKDKRGIPMHTFQIRSKWSSFSRIYILLLVFQVQVIISMNS